MNTLTEEEKEDMELSRLALVCLNSELDTLAHRIKDIDFLIDVKKRARAELKLKQDDLIRRQEQLKTSMSNIQTNKGDWY